MQPDLKTKWLEALRSGDYKQTTGVLRRKDEYCCLGVLANVIDPDGWEPLSTAETLFTLKGFKTLSVLPPDFLPYTELSGQARHELIQLNDVAKKTFPEIATYIEEKL